jgi:hypothetical protein
MSPSAQHHRKDDPPDFEPARAETDATGILPTDSRAERVLKLAIKLGFGTVLTAVILYWLAMSYLPSNEARADRLIEATRADLRDARQENVQLADRYLEAREQDRAVTSKLADSLRELATEIRLSREAEERAARDAWRRGERGVAQTASP